MPVTSPLWRMQTLYRAQTKWRGLVHTVYMTGLCPSSHAHLTWPKLPGRPAKTIKSESGQGVEIHTQEQHLLSVKQIDFEGEVSPQLNSFTALSRLSEWQISPDDVLTAPKQGKLILAALAMLLHISENTSVVIHMTGTGWDEILIQLINHDSYWAFHQLGG